MFILCDQRDIISQSLTFTNFKMSETDEVVTLRVHDMVLSM